MNYSKHHLLRAILVVSQTLILLPCQAQIVSESDNKSINSVSISPEVIPTTNTLLTPKASNSDNSRESAEIITANSNNSVSSVENKPNPRIPISSKIFDHPAMKQ